MIRPTPTSRFLAEAARFAVEELGVEATAIEFLGPDRSPLAEYRLPATRRADPDPRPAEPPRAKSPAPGPALRCAVEPGDEFRSLRWFGRVYHFSPQQALAVATLYNAWKKELPDVAGS